MTLIQENGRADWFNNPQYLRILYSIMKVYMQQMNLDEIPYGKVQHLTVIASRFSSAIGENISPAQVDTVSYLPFDASEPWKTFTPSSLLRLQIGIEVGLLNTNFIRKQLKRIYEKAHQKGWEDHIETF